MAGSQIRSENEGKETALEARFEVWYEIQKARVFSVAGSQIQRKIRNCSEMVEIQIRSRKITVYSKTMSDLGLGWSVNLGQNRGLNLKRSRSKKRKKKEKKRKERKKKERMWLYLYGRVREREKRKLVLNFEDWWRRWSNRNRANREDEDEEEVLMMISVHSKWVTKREPRASHSHRPTISFLSNFLNSPLAPFFLLYS